MKQNMRVHDPDMAIHRAVQELNATQPPAGMQQRLVARLTQYEASPKRKRIAHHVYVHHWAWAASGLGVVAFAALLGMYAMHVQRHQPFKAAAAEPVPSSTQRSLSPAETHGPTLVYPQQHAREPIHLALQVHAMSHAPKAAQQAQQTELDTQALEDFNAPSQPPPPLPSTAQERLVRLMLRRGEQHDLAELEPGRELSVAQQERSSFSNFFDPPPSPELAEALRKAMKEQIPNSVHTTQPSSPSGDPQ